MVGKRHRSGRELGRHHTSFLIYVCLILSIYLWLVVGKTWRSMVSDLNTAPDLNTVVFSTFSILLTDHRTISILQYLGFRRGLSVIYVRKWGEMNHDLKERVVFEEELNEETTVAIWRSSRQRWKNWSRISRPYIGRTGTESWSTIWRFGRTRSLTGRRRSMLWCQ